MAVGSMFSLGISYMSDLLPSHLLPAGNLLCGISFSLGSMIGPVAGGWYMQRFESANLFYFITVILVCIWLALVFGKTKHSPLPNPILFRPHKKPPDLSQAASF